MSVSVCMATYNGEKFVVPQVRSILDQLGREDELIVVDDCSSDGTVDVIRRLADSRIAIHLNERNRREVYSFGRAIALARHEHIFMADQDDIWIPGRVAVMSHALRAAALVTTNFDCIDERGQPSPEILDGVSSLDSDRHLKNIVDIFIGKTNYFGCAMAFRRDLVSLILPIPGYVESHDLWLALAANVSGSNAHLDESTLLKRRHGSNVTSPVSSRSVYQKLRSRAGFVLSLLQLWYRSKRRRRLQRS